MNREEKKVTASAIIYDGVLNDDRLDEIKHGDTYKYALYYYTYANEWSNHEHIATFDYSEDAMDYYMEMFPERMEMETDWLNERQEEGLQWTPGLWRWAILDLFHQ